MSSMKKKNFFFIHFKVLQLHNCLKEIQHLVHISFTMSLALLWPFTPDSFSSPQGTPSSALQSPWEADPLFHLLAGTSPHPPWLGTGNIDSCRTFGILIFLTWCRALCLTLLHGLVEIFQGYSQLTVPQTWMGQWKTLRKSLKTCLTMKYMYGRI